MHFVHKISTNYQNVFHWCFNFLESIGNINSESNVMKQNGKTPETKTYRIRNECFLNVLEKNNHESQCTSWIRYFSDGTKFIFEDYQKFSEHHCIWFFLLSQMCVYIYIYFGILRNTVWISTLIQIIDWHKNQCVSM